MTAVRTGIKLFLTRSKLVQLYCNQWLYDYVLMHVFVCVKLSAFYSPCARIIVEDHVYSARAGQDVCFVTDCEIVGIFLPKCESTSVMKPYNYLMPGTESALWLRSHNQTIPPQVHADISNASLELLNKSHEDDTIEFPPLLPRLSSSYSLLPKSPIKFIFRLLLSTLSKLQN